MKLICPTDFSLNAYHAMYYAAMMASKTGNELLLIHVINPSISSPALKGIQADEEQIQTEKAEQLLKIFSQEIHDKHAGISISFKVMVGKTAESVYQMAVQEKDPLVIMGTRGTSNIRKKILGSNTMHVMKQATFPVLAVPEDALLAAPERMVFATKYYLTDHDAINFMIALSELLKSELQILHITDGTEPEEKEQSLLRDFAAWITAKSTYKYLKFKLFRNKNVIKGITDYSISVNADFLGITTHKKYFPENIMEPDFTGTLLSNPEIPLIVFPFNYVFSEIRSDQ